MMEHAGARAPYLLVVVLAVVGMYILLTHRNLMKSFVGLYLVQLGIVLFFIMVAVRSDGAVPVVPDGGAAELDAHNPLPHALMVTAIVVSVATLGVAMAILLRVQREEGSIDDGAPEGERAPEGEP